MSKTLERLEALARGAAEEAEGDWFCHDLIESNMPILSTRKARRYIAAASPEVILRLVEIVKAAETVVRTNEDGEPLAWLAAFSSLREALSKT